MAKRKRMQQYEKFLEEGRGKGIGSSYKPWLTIQDVPSSGRALRAMGIKTKRQHELLSDLETAYFYILDYSDYVYDIREQFPLLPRETTEYLAKTFGIVHPRNPETQENIAMTTDFLITEKIDNKFVNVARTIKPKSQLIDKRVIEKFEIERAYWEKEKVDWAIVTEDDIDRVVSHNILLFHSYYDISKLKMLGSLKHNDLLDLEYEYIKRIIPAEKTIREYSKEFDKDLCLKEGSGLNIFMHLLATKMIRIDLTKPLEVNNINEIICIHNNLEKEAGNNDIGRHGI